MTLWFTRRAFSRLAGLALVVAAGLAAAQAQPAAPAAVTVLAAHPIVVSLAEALTAGTSIDVVRAAPANLPPTRWASYFDGRGAAALKRDAARADAVLTLRSLWPDDPLYPLARRTNIRIVEIDAARPVDGALPGIALQAADRGVGRDAGRDAGAPLAAQPWLSPANLGRMADIVATDLQRLVPEARQPVGQNLAALKQRLVALTAQAEAALAAAPPVSVIVLSDRLDYLVAALNLDRVPFEQAGAWEVGDPAAARQLAAAVQAQEVAAVLHHEAVPEEVQRAVREGPTEKETEKETRPEGGVAWVTVESASTVEGVEAALQAVVNAVVNSLASTPQALGKKPSTDR